MVCCTLVTAALGLVLAVIVGRRGGGTVDIRIATPAYLPAVLEATQLTGYPEGRLPTPETVSHGTTPQEEKLDHGCAQAQDVAREHP